VRTAEPLPEPSDTSKQKSQAAASAVTALFALWLSRYAVALLVGICISSQSLEFHLSGVMLFSILFFPSDAIPQKLLIADYVQGIAPIGSNSRKWQ